MGAANVAVWFRDNLERSLPSVTELLAVAFGAGR
jgi:hypothetical protein